MRIELVPPDPDNEPDFWVPQDQALAMMLRPGSMESGSKRTALEKFDYGLRESPLRLPDRP